MKISQQGIDFIKGHEGLRLTAYRCTSGVLTIGYGHTRGVKPQQVITQPKAEQLLCEDIIVAETAINRFVTAPITQHQYDALVSLAFNIGAGAFKRSTLLFVINQKQGFETIKQQFMKWIYSAGKPSNGLKKRRAEEVDLFVNGYDVQK